LVVIALCSRSVALSPRSPEAAASINVASSFILATLSLIAVAFNSANRNSSVACSLASAAPSLSSLALLMSASVGFFGSDLF
jgi:hypothetical protein